MKFGTIELEKWKQPPDIILGPLSNLSSLLMPVDSEWTTSRKGVKDGQIYCGNLSNIYGIDVLSVQSQIYLKTRKWPRVIVHEFHFRIPGWKHLIERFGAVRSDSMSDTDLAIRIAELGHPIIVYPFDFLKVSDVKTTELKNYSVIPFASTGASDMVKNLLKISAQSSLQIAL